MANIGKKDHGDRIQSMTVLEILVLFIMILLTIMAYLIFSNALNLNSYSMAISNVLLIMIFGALLSTNIILLRIKIFLNRKEPGSKNMKKSR